MRILITGAAGFIGSNLVEELVRRNHSVIALDNFYLGRKDNLSSVLDKIELVNGSITDEPLIQRVTANTDAVINLAAASSSQMFTIDNVREAIRTNVDGFLIILKAAVKNGAKRVLYASTSSIYGNNNPPLREDMKVDPPNMYSATKLMNEHCAKLFSQEYGLETVGYRFLSVYGPHEECKGIYANLVSQFLWAIMKGEQPIVYGDGTQKRDFTYVKDIVQGIVLGLESKNPLLGEVVNVGSGNTHSFNELVSLINKMVGKNIKPRYIPNPVKNYIADQDCDISKIKVLLRYSPKYTLEKGLAEMLQTVMLDKIRQIDASRLRL